MKYWSIHFITLTLMVAVTVSAYSQNYDVVFTKQVNGSDHIYATNLNGKAKQITHHLRKDSSPMISPDGKYMVFTSERVGWWKIWLINLENNVAKQLTNSSNAEYNPVWSPNGEHIVFVSSRDGNAEIYKIDRNGKNLVNISQSNGSDTMPFWGKDNMIYYSSDVNGLYQIMRMHPDGSTKEAITKNKGDKLMPQLSNDCKKILYYGNLDGNYNIYTINTNGSEQKRLTNHSLMDMRPRWSFDDEKIVFERGNKKDNHHIYMMDFNGESIKQLTFSNYNYSASFIPDNATIFNKE